MFNFAPTACFALPTTAQMPVGNSKKFTIFPSSSIFGGNRNKRYGCFLFALIILSKICYQNILSKIYYQNNIFIFKYFIKNTFIEFCLNSKLRKA